jgi:hypothetical protein
MADQTEDSIGACIQVKTTFRPDDYSRIAEQAHAEGRAVANWLRHVALTQLSVANQPALGTS